MGLLDIFRQGQEANRTNTAGAYPLGRGGVQGLRDILQNYFLPELSRARSRRQPIEQAFAEQSLTPGALYEGAATAARGKAQELFAPGGEVATMIGRARGKSIGQGFDPGSAMGDENVILRGATDTVGRTFAQNAAALEAKRADMLTASYGQNDVRDLIESLFTGVGSAEQLNLAKNPPRQKFLGIF